MLTDELVAWGTVAGAAFLGLAAGLGWIELRRGAQARETAVLLDLALRWLDPWVVDAIQASNRETSQTVRTLAETPVANRTPEEQEKWLLLQRLPNFLEAIGYLERDRSAIKVRDVEGFWGSQIAFVWDLWELSIKEVLRPKQSIQL